MSCQQTTVLESSSRKCKISPGYWITKYPAILVIGVSPASVNSTLHVWLTGWACLWVQIHPRKFVFSHVQHAYTSKLPVHAYMYINIKVFLIRHADFKSVSYLYWQHINTEIFMLYHIAVWNILAYNHGQYKILPIVMTEIFSICIGKYPSIDSTFYHAKCQKQMFETILDGTSHDNTKSFLK